MDFSTLDIMIRKKDKLVQARMMNIMDEKIVPRTANKRDWVDKNLDNSGSEEGRYFCIHQNSMVDSKKGKILLCVTSEKEKVVM